MANFWEGNTHIYTSSWMNFTSNPSLQDIFHQFDLEMPPKGVIQIHSERIWAE